MVYLTRILPLALVLGLAAPAMAQDNPVSAASLRAGVVSIQGVGEVTAAPDTAFVTSGVTTQGATAREALDANSAAMAELIETLKAAGIEARDIQTSGFSVNPNYVYTDQRDANGYNLPPKIAGYQVSNTVTVKVRDLAGLGAILDQSVSVGANTVNGVSFSVADPSELYDQARRAAFADAREKAELYAEIAGVELDSLVNVTESQSYGQPQPYAIKEVMAAPQADRAVPVEAGEMTFSINVQVSWLLDQDQN